jgi:hypothetical protein
MILFMINLNLGVKDYFVVLGSISVRKLHFCRSGLFSYSFRLKYLSYLRDLQSLPNTESCQKGSELFAIPLVGFTPDACNLPVIPKLNTE